MKRLATLEIEKVIGGDLDAGCGFAIGVGTVAAFTTAPIAPMTWGWIVSGVVSICGAAILDKIKL